MRNRISLGLVILVLGSLLAGCKDVGKDPYRVVNRYLASLESKDYQNAYSYLSDKQMMITESGGRELYFVPRPDVAVFTRSYTGVEEIEIRSVKQGQRYSDSLIRYDVQIRLVQNDSSEVDSIGVYLAQDSTGRWGVLTNIPSAQAVLNLYLGALERLDFKTAHSYLSTYSLSMEVGEEKLSFVGRPDLKTYSSVYSDVERIEVLSVNPVYRVRERLEVYAVQLRITRGGKQNKRRAQVYLMAERKGRWRILVPSSYDGLMMST